jgi:hypothetical protein
MSTESLRPLHRGISLVYYGLYLIVASILVAMVGGGVAAGVAGRAGALTVMILVGGMVFVGTVLGFAGRVVCLNAPDDLSGKNLIYVAVILDVICLAITAAGWFTTLPGIADQLHSLLALTATILFLVFLKSVAAYVSDSESERRAGNVLKIGVGVFFTMLVGVFFPPLLLIALLLMLVGFVVYVLLLMGLRTSLSAT